jgi:hypothetical protein
MRILLQTVYLLSITILLASCRSAKTPTVQMQPGEKGIVDLVNRLKSNPRDRETSMQLETTYREWLNNITQSGEDARKNVAERYLAKAEEWESVKRVHDLIKANPAALEAVPYPYDPTIEIRSYREKSAREYYDQGMNYMRYQNRVYAEKAYQEFTKADKIVPGYMDVKQRMAEAQQMSIQNVVVTPVNYYNNPFSYWGFTNDWLQNRMVMDLNAFSGRNLRFFTEWEASSKRIQVDKVVQLQFRELFVGPVTSSSQTYTRTAQIDVTASGNTLTKPTSQTVTANLYVTTRTMVSNAVLEMRILDRATGRTTFTDRYPGNYTWKSVTASYKGDKRALTQDDLRLIGNSFNSSVPNRNETAERLINDCYNLMLSRIKSGVRFE